MDQIAEILVTFCLVIAGVFGLVGSFGLLKLRDTMQRLHAPTKATTLGVGGVLVASMIYFYFIEGSLSFHELLITLFLFLTAPVSANFIAKTLLIEKKGKIALPETDGKKGWATNDSPPNVADSIQG